MINALGVLQGQVALAGKAHCRQSNFELAKGVVMRAADQVVL